MNPVINYFASSCSSSSGNSNISCWSNFGVVTWEFPRFRRGPGLPHTNWRNTVNKDLLLKMGITWVEMEVAALNRSEWHLSVT